MLNSDFLKFDYYGNTLESFVDAIAFHVAPVLKVPKERFIIKLKVIFTRVAKGQGSGVKSWVKWRRWADEWPDIIWNDPRNW